MEDLPRVDIQSYQLELLVQHDHFVVYSPICYYLILRFLKDSWHEAVHAWLINDPHSEVTFLDSNSVPINYEDRVKNFVYQAEFRREALRIVFY